MAEYGKVFKKIWRNERFRSLSEDGQSLFLYLVTSPHSNVIGLFLIAIEYMASDKGWTIERARKALADLELAGFVKYDKETCVLLIPSWFEHNPFTSGNQVKKGLAELSEVPKTPLLQELKAIINAKPEGLWDGIADAITDGIPNAITDSVSETVTESEAESENNTGRVKKDSNIPYEQIIEHLNSLTGKGFKSDSANTIRFINGRWREGFRLEDFLYVNQVKTEEWVGTEREKYLRPKTLYSADNFEGYRQQRRVDVTLTERQRTNALNGIKWLQKHGFEVKDGEFRQREIPVDPKQIG